MGKNGRLENGSNFLFRRGNKNGNGMDGTCVEMAKRLSKRLSIPKSAIGNLVNVGRGGWMPKMPKITVFAYCC
jgi:hypothetical protein